MLKVQRSTSSHQFSQSEGSVCWIGGRERLFRKKSNFSESCV